MATINKIKVGNSTYDLQSDLSVTTSGSGSMVSNVAYNTATKGITVTKTNPQEAYITFGGPNKAGDITPVDLATMEQFSANRLALAKPAGITIEYSNDGGTTWTDYGASDASKISLVSSGSVTLNFGKRTTANTGIDADRLRITLNATNMGVYTAAKKLYINYSSNGLTNTKVLIETSNKGSETTWTKFGEYGISGWSGWNSIPISFNFGGSSGQTGNKANIRLTFYGTHSTTGNYTKCIASILNLALVGTTYWNTPSNLAKTGHMYKWDYNKNTIFDEGGVSIGKSTGPSSSYKLDVNGAINGTSVYSNGKQVINSIKMEGSSTALAVSSGTVVIPTVAGEKGADGISIGTITATATSVASNVAPTVTVSQVTSGTNKNATFAFSIPKGANGTNGTGIGTVTATVASAASTATPKVTVSSVTSGSNKNCTFAFTLPKGADGTNGTNGISVGTVTATVASVASNVAPSVTVSTVTSGTNKNVTMAFKLPKGDTGATGPSGVVSVVTAGSGNAVTSGSYNSATKTVTLTKGGSFLTSSSLGNYLPLSGGTMTGPIVQNGTFDILQDTTNDSWINLKQGFCFYNTNGDEFARLGDSYFDIEKNGDDCVKIGGYLDSDKNSYGVLSVCKNNGDDNFYVTKGSATLYDCYDNSEAIVQNATSSYGTIQLNDNGIKQVFISGSTNGDQAGYPRIELYNDGELFMNINTSWGGIKFESTYGQIGVDSNRLAFRTVTTNSNLLHWVNSNYYTIWDDNNTKGYTPAQAIQMNKDQTILSEYADLNNIKTPGFYYCSGSGAASAQTNNPYPVAYSLQVYKDVGIMQIYYPYGDYVGRFYIRTLYGSSWSSWKEFNDTTYNDNRYLKLTGGTLTGSLTAPAFYQTSDIRKKDIKEEISLDKCYDLIDKCQTIIYSLKDQTKEQVGMIAQEVEEFFPEVIQTDEEGFKSLDYSRLVVICFKVLKDLIKRVSKLEEK